MPATIRFSARHRPEQPVAETLCEAIAVAARFAEASRLQPALSARLSVVVEELVGNLLRHGKAACDIAIELTLAREGEGVGIVLEDNCLPFDPRQAGFPGPDAEAGGGVGLALVRGLAEIEDYASRDGVNRLTLRLRG